MLSNVQTNPCRKAQETTQKNPSAGGTSNWKICKLINKQKWKDFQKKRSIENLISYKKARALFKRETKI